ncbi:hypothetical protein KI387_032846, partial [Taxus chinensis]
MAFYISLNLLGNMVFNINLFDPHNPASMGFEDIIKKMMKHGGLFSISWVLGSSWLATGSMRHQKTKYMKGICDFFDLLIQDTIVVRRKNLEKESEKYFLDVLLDFRSEDFTLVGV